MNEQINNLLEQYKDNEYILKRIHYHITQILPATLKNEKQNWEQRQERNKYLLKEQQLFIQIFLSKHDYYYLPGNYTFYEYDKITYSVIKEDDIIDIVGLTTFAPNQPLTLVLNHADGTTEEIKANHTYNEQQIEWFKAGGALNIIRMALI